MIINVRKIIPSTTCCAKIDTDELGLTEEELKKVKGNPELIIEYINGLDSLDWEEDQFSKYLDIEYIFNI